MLQCIHMHQLSKKPAGFLVLSNDTETVKGADEAYVTSNLNGVQPEVMHVWLANHTSVHLP